MPRLRRLTARDVLRLLGRHAFEVASIRGSHAKLARIGPSGTKETLVVSLHRQLTVGTVQAIYRQACRYIEEEAEEDLRSRFFAD
ncbi:MAG: type II toxin-antitoxin system HicA family toxin [Gammaproteobacteria bacterium]|nr:type II toxin-antitoxin system HicA family toxin [Gammaproteobacteria bacterium]